MTTIIITIIIISLFYLTPSQLYIRRHHHESNNDHHHHQHNHPPPRCILQLLHRHWDWFQLASCSFALDSERISAHNLTRSSGRKARQHWEKRMERSNGSTDHPVVHQTIDLVLWNCWPPSSPEIPKKFKVTQKWLKSDLRGLFQSDPKSNPKSDFLTLESHFWVTFGVEKSLFGLLVGSLWKRPRKSLFCHFWVTLNSSGFRGS